MTPANSAREAYDRFAAAYDDANAQNDYEAWLGRALLPELEKHGLRKGWALDVGCGTGRAFDPLLSRGWQIVGSDMSAGMLAEAERKFGPGIELVNADARELPSIRPSSEHPDEEAFELVLLLNDVVNYMTEDGDLEKVFAGVRRNLSPDHGLVAFDVNSIELYRASFSSGISEEMSARGVQWRGLSEEVEPGGVFEAELSGSGVEPHVHRQRHWKIEQVEAALEASGLRQLAFLGLEEKDGQILLAEPVDEARHYKMIFIATQASR
jgi:SAM-dependent methyltransferase